MNFNCSLDSQFKFPRWNNWLWKIQLDCKLTAFDSETLQNYWFSFNFDISQREKLICRKCDTIIYIENLKYFDWSTAKLSILWTQHIWCHYNISITVFLLSLGKCQFSIHLFIFVIWYIQIDWKFLFFLSIVHNQQIQTLEKTNFTALTMILPLDFVFCLFGAFAFKVRLAFSCITVHVTFESYSTKRFRWIKIKINSIKMSVSLTN